MFVPAQQLVERFRRLRRGGQPRSRIDELDELRRRLRSQPRRLDGDYAEEAELAAELRRMKEELSAALAGVTSCGTCARGFPLPNGRWEGGNCCGASTLSLFDEPECGALRLAGTTPARMRPPRSDHAGCAFRGPTGCSLQVADRPYICVRYVCKELARELHARGELDRIDAMRDRMGAVYQRFLALREERLLDEALGLPPE